MIFSGSASARYTVFTDTHHALTRAAFSIKPISRNWRKRFTGTQSMPSNSHTKQISLYSDIKYILSDADMSWFLGDDIQKIKQRYRQYWNKRNPTPGSKGQCPASGGIMRGSFMLKKNIGTMDSGCLRIILITKACCIFRRYLMKIRF